MDDTGAQPQPDGEFLEDLLDRAVDDYADGEDACLCDALRERPHLRARIEEIATLVEQVAVRRTGLSPVIPGFDVVREVGRGGMGVVYEAWDPALRRRVAIKVIAPHRAASLRDRSRFDREATSLARIRHPNIVQVFGSGNVGASPYVVMEFIDGAKLSARLPDAKVTTRRDEIVRMVGICARLARGLDQAHEAGVIHRDVKPGNILVDRQGEPTLVDFGLAQELGEATLTASGEFVGTLAYTAPEQALGQRVDRRADVFGLGATLHHALTGAPPFAANTLVDLLRLIESGTRPSRASLFQGLPRDIVTILDRATATAAGDRYGSCADLADDLEAFLDGRPITARRTGIIEHGFRWVRRKPVAAALVGTLAACGILASALGVSWWQERQSRAASELERRIVHALCRSTFGSNREAEDLLGVMAREHPDDVRIWTLRVVNALEEGLGRLTKGRKSKAAIERAKTIFDRAPRAFAIHPAGIELARVLGETVDALEPGMVPSERSPAVADVPPTAAPWLALVLARSSGRRHEALELLYTMRRPEADFMTHFLYAGLTLDQPSFEGLSSAVIAQALRPSDTGPMFLLASYQAAFAKKTKLSNVVAEEALSLARQACALEPGNPQAQSTLGFIAHDLFPAEAEKAYRKSLALRSSGVARWNLNGLLAGLKKLDPKESLELLRPIEQDYGHLWDYWRNLSWAEGKANGALAAIATLERGLPKVERSGFFQIHSLLSSYHMDLSQQPEHVAAAIEAWVKCFECAPDDTDGMHALACALTRSHPVEQMRRFVDRCERLQASGVALTEDTQQRMKDAATGIHSSR